MIINGSELLDKTDDYDEWLKAVIANTKMETVNPNWVVTDTFFAVDETNRMIGIIDLRHTLNGRNQSAIDSGSNGECKTLTGGNGVICYTRWYISFYSGHGESCRI